MVVFFTPSDEEFLLINPNFAKSQVKRYGQDIRSIHSENVITPHQKRLPIAAAVEKGSYIFSAGRGASLTIIVSL